MPKNPRDSHAVWRYLREVRKLPDQVIGELSARGLLYQDTRRNCVFVCFDRRGRARAATLRGTRRGDSFRGEALGSDADYGWVWTPTGSAPFCPTVVSVTESAIDAISFGLLFPALRASPILSLNGAGMWGALETFLREWPETRTVVLALDNDETGKQATARYKARLQGDGYDVALFVPEAYQKDWNEQLSAVSPL